MYVINVKKGNVVMKKTFKLIAAALVAITAMSCTSATVFADKLKSVDGVTYRYSDSGEQVGKYTGWAKTSKGRRYYKNGVMLKKTWLKAKTGKYYYIGKDGYMSTGFVKVTRDKNKGEYSYFDENGVWDGNTYASDSFDSVFLYDITDVALVPLDEVEIGSAYTDYFTLDDKDDLIFYANISDSPAWKGKKFTKGKILGEIKVVTDKRKLSAIPEYAANVLPVGTKIYYVTNFTGVRLAEVDGKLIPYVQTAAG